MFGLGIKAGESGCGEVWLNTCKATSGGADKGLSVWGVFVFSNVLNVAVVMNFERRFFFICGLFRF